MGNVAPGAASQGVVLSQYTKSCVSFLSCCFCPSKFFSKLLPLFAVVLQSLARRSFFLSVSYILGANLVPGARSTSTFHTTASESVFRTVHSLVFAPLLSRNRGGAYVEIAIVVFIRWNSYDFVSETIFRKHHNYFNRMRLDIDIYLLKKHKTSTFTTYFHNPALRINT